MPQATVLIGGLDRALSRSLPCADQRPKSERNNRSKRIPATRCRPFSLMRDRQQRPGVARRRCELYAFRQISKLLPAK